MKEDTRVGYCVAEIGQAARLRTHDVRTTILRIRQSALRVNKFRISGHVGDIEAA